MIELEFNPWAPFRARKKPEAIKRWLEHVGEASRYAFLNMGTYPPASSPGQYPARRTGRLRASINWEATASSVTIGSGMPYSKYLREGTKRMERRNMSDTALKEGMRNTHLWKWVEWSRL